MNQSPWVQNIFKALSQSAGKNRDSALKKYQLLSAENHPDITATVHWALKIKYLST